ncbi:hypothetical protein [Nocardia crassostreae]|uniref:hypothetical protein n=1 Tax=Nocardia crassostreae TaxID=53428 RepID=UPI00082A482F|nr:hypothetical protein [Nocardia crassostreae]
MILVFVAKDMSIVDKGYKDSYTDKSDSFGIAYAYNKKLWPGGIRLEKKENLFITAHGNDEEIGDADDTGPAMSFEAATLAGILKQIIPTGYTGDIYLSTCNSYEYAKSLEASLGTLTSGSDFYGTKKTIPYKIQGPGGSNWHKVTT